MVYLNNLDILIIILFFLVLITIGFLASKNGEHDRESFLLNNRKVGLILFVITNVSTWYGGILGVGEFTYRYGILSWITQGLPYYLFAILFAYLFAEKIRNSVLITIPEKIEEVYGKKTAAVSSLLIFFLVQPAPYIYMVASLFSLILDISLLASLIISAFFSSIYLLKGGFKADLYTDVFQFVIMFIGFILIVIVAASVLGGYSYLETNLPIGHLSIPDSITPHYIIVWFIIASWTFADPGFHQRCYAAKSAKTAKYGIIISIIFWAFFDFLTTTTGLYAKAYLPNLTTPVMAFPIFADKLLMPGLKGLFFIAMFATILSTSNSFTFLSATTFGNDLMKYIFPNVNEFKKLWFVKVGLILTMLISVVIAYFYNSVIEIWYSIGSVCIPGLILLIISAYYKKFKISNKIAFYQIIIATLVSFIWLISKSTLIPEQFLFIEPMIAGLSIGIIIHLWGIIKLRNDS
ncbi:MAG: sodium:solute symporter family protein [Melioribacteraceae bacterium]|nr:sodium:solute symporter family protein [Melioribacteraceae bacterium]